MYVYQMHKRFKLPQETSMKIVISHLLVTTKEVHEDCNFSLIGYHMREVHEDCNFSLIGYHMREVHEDCNFSFIGYQKRGS